MRRRQRANWRQGPGQGPSPGAEPAMEERLEALRQLLEEDVELVFRIKGPGGRLVVASITARAAVDLAKAAMADQGGEYADDAEALLACLAPADNWRLPPLSSGGPLA